MQFKIMDLKPSKAVTIIECDVNVEFDAPDGYVEPQIVKEMVFIFSVLLYLLILARSSDCSSE
jgi:hypothetical protein